VKKSRKKRDEAPEMEDSEVENGVFEEQREQELMTQSSKPEELSKKEREIQKLEAKLVEKKEWNFRGEVSGKDRPKDALLEEDLDFKMVHQPGSSISKVTKDSFLHSFFTRFEKAGKVF
jgi:U3 small nucleolar ribonucleoprotein component